jgi:hypothetical protein
VVKNIAGNNKQKVKSGPNDPKDFHCCSCATSGFRAFSDAQSGQFSVESDVCENEAELAPIFAASGQLAQVPAAPDRRSVALNRG